jgi:hypothetical protein
MRPFVIIVESHPLDFRYMLAFFLIYNNYFLIGTIRAPMPVDMTLATSRCTDSVFPR